MFNASTTLQIHLIKKKDLPIPKYHIVVSTFALAVWITTFGVVFEFMLANYPTESMNKLILTDNKIDFTKDQVYHECWHYINLDRYNYIQKLKKSSPHYENYISEKISLTKNRYLRSSFSSNASSRLKSATASKFL